MPSAWRWRRRCWRREFNRPGFDIVDHHTYVFCGDGCLMEGISHEACSLAGTLGLGKLIVFYDDNGISIDGKVAGWFTDDTPKRFEAYGWHVIPNVDGLNAEAVRPRSRRRARRLTRPSLICCKTIIGYGAPNKQGTAEAHGEALGRRRSRGGAQDARLALPAVRDSRRHSRRLGSPQQGRRRRRPRGGSCSRATQPSSRSWRASSSGACAASCPRTGSSSPTRRCRPPRKQTAPQATRQSSQAVLNVLGPALPELLGGSADLTPSNNTLFKDARTITPARTSGNYMHYGVREFGMTAVMNGIALHGGFIPYGGTFLVFSDYARNAVRLACLMSVRIVLVYTHDSIGLGEDGPTHQPIEHLASLRAMPHMTLWRPCDAVETAVAWASALERKGPTALVLTRQALPQQPRSGAAARRHPPRRLRADRAAGRAGGAS